MRSLSQVLTDVSEQMTQTGNSHITIEAIMQLLHERGFGVMIILFAIPGAIPGCPPPLPSIIALPLCYLSAQMAMAYHVPKLPAFIGKKNLSIASLTKAIALSMRYIRFVEKYFIKPRLEFMTTAKSERFLGVMMFIFSFVVLIPLPLTNSVPSLANIIIGIGLLSRDGLAIIGGVILGIIWIIILGFLSNELINAAMAMIS